MDTNYKTRLDMTTFGCTVHQRAVEKPWMSLNSLATQNFFADNFDPLADNFDHLADNFDHLADNYDLLADNYDHLTDNYDHLTNNYDYLTDNYDHLTDNFDHLAEEQWTVSRTKRPEHGHIEYCPVNACIC